jgi:Sulfatase-modifying factor enzyme 1
MVSGRWRTRDLRDLDKPPLKTVTFNNSHCAAVGASFSVLPKVLVRDDAMIRTPTIANALRRTVLFPPFWLLIAVVIFLDVFHSSGASVQAGSNSPASPGAQSTADWYRPDYYSQLATAGGVAPNPKGPETSFDPAEPSEKKKVHRGGSFLCTDQYCSRYIVGTRGMGEVSTRTDHLGFRCVANVRN